MGDDVASELRRLGSATLGESGAVAAGPGLVPVWPGARFAGPAVTASCPPGDNLAIHVAVAEAGPGSVVVADASRAPEHGHWGEVLATAAQARGVVGLAIDGCVRDVDALERIGFPVLSTGVALPGTRKQAGRVGVTIELRGARVRPGDWVVGDRDGVVVIASGALEDVLAAARERAERERGWFDHLRAGATTLELLGLDREAVARGDERRAVEVTRILHASVNCAGALDATQRFYAEVLGLDEIGRPSIPGVAGRWFGLGGAQLHLVGAPSVGEGIDPTGHHTCFGVADLAAAVAELEERGIPYREAWQGTVRQIWVVDPAGYTIELQQDTAIS